MRRALADHVESFAVERDDQSDQLDREVDNVKSEQISAQILSVLPTIQSILHELLGQHASATEVIDWLHVVSASQPSYDGLLAIALSLMKNINELKASKDRGEPLYHTVKAVGRPWKAPHQAVQPERATVNPTTTPQT